MEVVDTICIFLNLSLNQICAVFHDNRNNLLMYLSIFTLKGRRAIYFWILWFFQNHAFFMYVSICQISRTKKTNEKWNAHKVINIHVLHEKWKTYFFEFIEIFHTCIWNCCHLCKRRDNKTVFIIMGNATSKKSIKCTLF